MSAVPLFEIDDLHVSTRATDTEPAIELLAGLSLRVDEGETHALIGRPEPGLSSLASALLGSPDHEVTAGRIVFRGDDITDWAPDIRAKAGLFLASPHAATVSGLSLLALIRQAIDARQGVGGTVPELRRSLLDWAERLGLQPDVIDRPADDDRSAVERAGTEILQLAMLESEMAILDETGPAQDIGAWRTMADGVRAVRGDRPTLGTLAITHAGGLIDHLRPDRLHVLVDGRIGASGGPELAERLETEGYESIT